MSVEWGGFCTDTGDTQRACLLDRTVSSLSILLVVWDYLAIDRQGIQETK